MKDYGKRLRALKAATKTIGDTYEARLAWLVEFLFGEPKLDYRAKRKSGDCLLSLASGGFTKNLVGGITLPEPLTPKEVESLRSELAVFVRSLLSDSRRVVPLPSEGLSVGLVRASTVGTKPAIYCKTYGFLTPRTALFHRVSDLLESAGGEFIACTVCGKPFLAVRKKKYCSRRCTNRANWEAYPQDKKREARERWYDNVGFGWEYGARKGSGNAKKK